MRLEWARVTGFRAVRSGLQRLEVVLDSGDVGVAICYPRLSGACDVGDRILLNTTAVDLALGTGGTHFVVARAETLEGVAHESASGGHIMKLRYAPHQIDVMAVEAPESPHHEVMTGAVSLEGMPVVCCGLHSQVPLVAAAIKRNRPDARVAYCMTDEAALPLALSDLIAQCVAAGLIETTITCGQAFGGDLEAINLHSGLLAAQKVAEADYAIVAIGPGVAGTGTPFGHGGVAQGVAVNAVGALGGVPVVCLRLSQADERERHLGVSHHTISALTQVALARATVAIPALPAEISDGIERQLSRGGVWAQHERADSLDGTTPSPYLHGITVKTMGRTEDQDPAFFAAAYAAGDVATSIR